MSHYKDIVLLVDLADEDHNIQELNAFLLLEHPGTKPQLEPAGPHGVWTASVNMLNMPEFVDKFQSLPWSEPSQAILLLRDENIGTWITHRYQVLV